MFLQKAVGIIEKIFDAILFILFLGIFVTVLIQITARFFPYWIVPWSEELTMLLYFYVICFGVPMAVKYGMFARVDIVFQFSPMKARLILEVVASVFIVAFFVVMLISSWPLIALGGRQLSFAMEISMVIFFITMPLLAIMSTISAIGRVIFLVNDLRNPDRVIKREKEAAERLARENEEAAKVLEKTERSDSGGGSKT